MRNYFAAAFSVLNDQRFEYYKSQESKSEMIQTHKDLLEGKVATATELALLYASLVEANGQNAVIGHIGDEWYVGVFTTNECLPLLVSDDVELIAQKAEKISMQGIAGKADVQDVVLAIANAEQTLDTVVALRDSAVKAYKEIMQMTV